MSSVPPVATRREGVQMYWLFLSWSLIVPPMWVVTLEWMKTNALSHSLLLALANGL